MADPNPFLPEVTAFALTLHAVGEELVEIAQGWADRLSLYVAVERFFPPGGRVLTDAAGVVWHVRAVTAAPMSPAQRRLLARPEYEHGWLLFQAETGEKRRLAPHPADWAARPDEELQAWGAAARPATYDKPTVPVAPVRANDTSPGA